MLSILERLQSHRSIRQYTDKPVEAALLHQIIKAAQCAATSSHVQAYTLIQVNDKDVRKQIADLAGPQPWVEKAPVFLVFCADLTRLEAACVKNRITAESGWTEQFIVATVDTALFAQNLMIGAESSGLGGVFIGGIRNDPDRVCELLNIPDQAYPVFGMCLGYPDQAPDIKPRLPLDLILKQDVYQGSCSKKEQAKRLNHYDTIIRDYYSNRGSNLKEATWQSQMARLMGQINRPHMKSFLEKKGFSLW